MCYSVQGEEQVEVLRDVLLCSGRGAGGGSARCATLFRERSRWRLCEMCYSVQGEEQVEVLRDVLRRKWVLERPANCKSPFPCFGV